MEGLLCGVGWGVEMFFNCLGYGLHSVRCCSQKHYSTYHLLYVCINLCMSLEVVANSTLLILSVVMTFKFANGSNCYEHV